ncbi:MAG: acetyl-CoA carboxylase carboxyl transferase subunit alpha, partial [Proteobacteria bacterium]|nr:acetyl-CoA carboxylase carboxyl transferase subunit alpha [Pseudomonadota bacterium]
LAIGVGDRLLMLQYSTYSVISPEGCASILWKSADKAKEAAEVMGITAARLNELGLVDRIIDEPLGGAHRDFDNIASQIKTVLVDELDSLAHIPLSELVLNRQTKLRQLGEFKDS